MVRFNQIIAAAVLAVSLGACTQGVGIASTDKSGKGGQNVSAFTRFPDMPLPKGAKIDLEHTLIFGADESWFGRIVLSAGHSADNIFGFYKRELPRFGWQEVTTTRSAVSTLTYSRQGRVATILIEGSTITGSDFSITVSPHGAPASDIAPRPTQ